MFSVRGRATECVTVMYGTCDELFFDNTKFIYPLQHNVQKEIKEAHDIVALFCVGAYIYIKAKME